MELISRKQMPMNDVYICHGETIDLCVLMARFSGCAVHSFGLRFEQVELRRAVIPFIYY